jgi:FkbM family methyltransferase
LIGRIEQLEAAIIDTRLHVVAERSEVASLRGEVASLRTDVSERIESIWNRAGSVEAAVNRLNHETLVQTLRKGTVDTILRAGPNAFFDCLFNGVRAKIPQATLRTMTHCVHADLEGGFAVAVETLHTDWLRSRLRPGDTFLDVGAATGAMTVPIALGSPGVRIVAFEPARTARRLLIDTLQANRIDGVEVHATAISDKPGTVQFSELKNDESGATPFLPEKSAISTDTIDPATIAETYDVPVTSLDAFFAGRSDGGTVKSVKIDVEGFETHVVRGAKAFLAAAKPHLAIDIHHDPFSRDSTEAGVRAVLAPLGYTFEKPNHVLLCTPGA